MNILEQDRGAPDTRRQSDSFFQDFTKYDFEDWLRTGLEKHLLQHIGPEAFPGASAELARYDFPAEGLDAVYRRLPPDQQPYFRLAAADLVNSWEITESNAIVWEHLLHLTALLPAKEVLRGLPAWLRAGYFQSLPEALANRLFNQVFLAVNRLVAHTREVVDCLRELIALPQFRADWSGMALEALWMCDSDNIASHFQRLRPYLYRLMANADHRPQTWAKRILDTVGLYRIVQALPSLEYFGQTNDSWLVKGLLAGKQPPVECWVGDDGNKLHFRLTGMLDTEETLSVGENWSNLLAYFKEQNLLAEPLLMGENWSNMLANHKIQKEKTT